MAGDDPDYLERVRRMVCCAPGCLTTPCEAHHPRVGVVGAALRGRDNTAIPLCTEHHRALHDLRGTFEAWDGESLRAWQQDRIEETRETVRILRLMNPPLDEADEQELPF